MTIKPIDIKKSSVVEWFLALEKDLADFLSYISFEEKNYNIWSPKITKIILESCSILDSLMRHIAPDSCEIKGKQKNRKKLTIEDFAELYTDKYGLHKSKVIFFNTPPSYRIPFAIWEDVKNESPKWWDAYNKLKHNRIEHIEKSTLINSVDSLAALFVLISRIPEMTRYIVQYELLQTGKYNPEHIIEELSQNRPLDDSFLVESSLFAIQIGDRDFPEDINELRPAAYVGSKRFYAFFGKW